MSLQPNEVLIIMLVALLVLGPKRLPGAIRSVGQAFRQVREFSTNVRQEIDATLSPPVVESPPPLATDEPDPPTDESNAQGAGAPSTDAKPTSGDGAA